METKNIVAKAPNELPELVQDKLGNTKSIIKPMPGQVNLKELLPAVQKLQKAFSQLQPKPKK